MAKPKNTKKRRRNAIRPGSVDYYTVGRVRDQELARESGLSEESIALGGVSGWILVFDRIYVYMYTFVFFESAEVLQEATIEEEGKEEGKEEEGKEELKEEEHEDQQEEVEPVKKKQRKEET